MGRKLDVPGGVVAHIVVGDDGAPLVEFYTGRFTVRYDVTELKKFVSVLQAWLREHDVEAGPADRRVEE